LNYSALKVSYPSETVIRRNGDIRALRTSFRHLENPLTAISRQEFIVRKYALM
jgi:hypothetical protein